MDVVDTKPTPQQQSNFKENVQRYFLQLTVGCGNPQCKNPHCASAVAPMNPNQAAALALKLASGTEHFCPPQIKASHLSVQKSRELVAAAKQSSDYTPLIRTLGSIFSEPEYLNVSFLTSGDFAVAATPESSGLDENAVADFFNEVEQMPANVRNALASAFERLVASLKVAAPRLVQPESLRQVVTVLQSPMLLDLEFHKTILGPLIRAIPLFPENSKSVLVSWWSQMSADRMRTFLGIVQQYITLRILAAPHLFSLHNDDFVPAAVRVLQLLYAANERMPADKLDYPEFYNDAINENIDLKEDFMRWIDGNGMFSFCDFSFVFDAGTKSKILQFESIVEQHHQRQEAIRRTIFTGMVSPPALVFKIRREHLIEDTLSAIQRHDPADLKKELRVHFVGEEAIDEGGVQKELFQLILRQILDAKYGMFTYSEEARTSWFNSVSTDFAEFKLIGIILGLAIYNGIILDLHFPFVVYKKLVGIEPTLDDLKDVNPGLAQGLRKLLEFEGNVEDAFMQNFQISYEAYGMVQTHDLKEGGADMPLTNANRQEYVDLYVRWCLRDSIAAQFEAFLSGFRLVCESRAFNMFRAEELEQLVCGSPILDFEELEKVTQYDSGYHPDHRVIKDFWAIVHAMTLDQKKRLLFFSTGSDRSPIGGLGKLAFVITRHGEDSDRLPQAHTCFNHLLLPEYASRDKLQERLLTAISNAEGFGMI
jgi:ubiquitin-protein ligase E3 A